MQVSPLGAGTATTNAFNLSPSCASDQRAAAVRAWSVGTLPVRHGARNVAQRGGAECDGKAGEPLSGFICV